MSLTSEEPVNISVFGLGYVGAVSAACLAGQGHRVIGVDVNPAKVRTISEGASPIVEKGLPELIREMVACGRLSATVSSAEAIAGSDISLICVGTPSCPNGSLDLRYIEGVCREIGLALAARPAGKRPPHVVVARSTMLPGTIASVIVPVLEEHSGLRAGRDFHVCINPEFLREGKSIEDFYDPPFVLIGADDKDAAATVRSIYRGIDARVFETAVKTAEMIKYTCNCFHAVKVTFANEIGSICKEAGIDSHEVMSLVCQDTKLNLSPYYLTPGFAFGGSCLPKDLRALNYKAREMDVEAPMLSSVLPSNRVQIERVVDLVLRTKRRRVGVIGLSFKAGTDDLRESPLVTLIERLIGRGLELTIYDPSVSLSRLIGANKEFIQNEIPHIDRLMRQDLGEVLSGADLIVLGTKIAGADEILAYVDEKKVVVDLVRLLDGRLTGGNYHGICW
jgi:GDP-mannose 6-dehydrogenase